MADADRRSILFPEQHWVFDHFDQYAGPATSRFYLDYLGSLTRPEFDGWGKPFAEDPYVAPFPPVDEEYFEWTDILHAVLDAGPRFTMLELGAGYGRWSVRAARAARQLGKSVSLGLAEADPRHQRWLQAHLTDNDVAAADWRLFDSAVAGTAGQSIFAVVAPRGREAANWFGQALMACDLQGKPVIGDYHGAPLYEGDGGWGCIIVPQIPLSQVLAPYDFIDIADFDLQGAEADAIAEALKPLTAKVRRLHIGTHGHDIEARLRDLLTGAGWARLRDFPCHGQSETPFGRCAFVDGVQSWVNPRLL